MRIRSGWLPGLAAVLLASAGCSPAEDDTGAEPQAGTGSAAGTGVAGSGASGSGAAGDNAAAGSGDTAGSGASGSGAAGDNSAAGTGASGSDAAGMAEAGSPAERMLDPDVDWTALQLVYPVMHSAYDGVHTFKVPVYVDGVTIELSDWSAIPETAVTFEADPESDAVLINVVEDVPLVTIAARSGSIGGTAELHITSSTSEQWEIGKARYANGVEFELDFTLETIAQMLLDPTWEPPEPPPNLACNNCHTTGAKYFEIQHTPTQAARFSDEDLRTILAEGMKPPGVGFRILPPMLGSQTDAEIYADYHRWESTEEEQVGLIVYLRSLTPTGQGDILLPDGTYVPAGAAPP